MVTLREYEADDSRIYDNAVLCQWVLNADSELSDSLQLNGLGRLNLELRRRSRRIQFCIHMSIIQYISCRLGTKKVATLFHDKYVLSIPLSEH